MMDKTVGVEHAMAAITNQFSTMCHERWIATQRILKLKAEMARRAAC